MTFIHVGFEFHSVHWIPILWVKGSYSKSKGICPLTFLNFCPDPCLVIMSMFPLFLKLCIQNHFFYERHSCYLSMNKLLQSTYSSLFLKKYDFILLFLSYCFREDLFLVDNLNSWLYSVALQDHPNPLMIELDETSIRRGAAGKRKRLNLADDLGGKRRSARVSFFPTPLSN